ncbi:hypothetical protein [Stenotrophomonas sp. SY1]|uniref:hypothetical protein n=1 Tax=Stenotrophomonas sp. SY1 TaxID=477235 RepID=UPI001E5CC317|nr:hypothetical protein [Stenotrophomonas sp. SY1]MCD9088171.1 hypothetical protein [Stenotrophomonas sp. SY1]
MDAFLAILPRFLLSALSALPLVFALLMAAWHLHRQQPRAYLRQVAAGTVAGIAALLLLWEYLFANGLARSSTSALIFVVAPAYTLLAYVATYLIALLACRRVAASAPVPGISRMAWLAPACLLAVLLVGMVKLAHDSYDITVAEHASDPETLRDLYAASQRGQADAFSVPLFLAQNPDTPSDVLLALARHPQASVRSLLLQHPHVPSEAVALLTNDADADIRARAQARMKATPQ